MTSPSELLAQIHNNFIQMFLIRPSIKIVQMVPLCRTKWQPELKIEIFSQHHFRWTEFKIITHNVSHQSNL